MFTLSTLMNPFTAQGRHIAEGAGNSYLNKSEINLFSYAGLIARFASMINLPAYPRFSRIRCNQRKIDELYSRSHC